MATINDVWTAYEEATGSWMGCNWRTHYGSLGLDLDGVSSGQARQTAKRWRAVADDQVGPDDLTAGEERTLVDMADHLRFRRVVVFAVQDGGLRLEVCGNPARQFCASQLAREWRFVVRWLEEIESDAVWAAHEAAKAVAAAEEGDWERACGHARQACAIEAGYYEPRRWRHLLGVIEDAAKRPSDFEEAERPRLWVQTRRGVSL
jgi:hypothetical protein